MNDPWDVKSVRQGHQYHSCMKINGVPLLPPLLSKECRREMQYYKLLAKEVEKRISILKPYIDSDTDTDKTEAPDLTESEDQAVEDNDGADIKFTDDTYSPREVRTEAKTHHSSNKHVSNCSKTKDSQIDVDLNVQIKGERDSYNAYQRSPRHSTDTDEVPERDCDNNNKEQRKLLGDLDNDRKKVHEELINSIIDFDIENGDALSDCITLTQDGPASLSSKSFTGSLNDIHTETSKETQGPKLIRQRSYTVLKPSPQLLAHLEVQSINTGVELSSISMSESVSTLNVSSQKRKSWDLETAKVKWSSMAMELKTKNIAPKPRDTSKDRARSKTRSLHTSQMAKSKSMSQDRGGKGISNKRSPKSEPVKSRLEQNSVTNGSKGLGNISANNNTVKNSSNLVNPKKEEKFSKAVALISDSDDPATRVRELYEKLQKQQLTQMANLVEKQRREQQLLQQVFEEQNSILLKQLKNVCPKASIEVKQAWVDLKDDKERGPVSLSQLINTSTPHNSEPNSPALKTLTDPNNFIDQCESILKKSRNITDSIRKQTSKSRSANASRNQKSDPIDTIQSSKNYVNSNSPASKNTSRKLKYDTPASSDIETMLTDQTNDTFADLNVTFPSDNSDCVSYSKGHSVGKVKKINATRACSPMSPRSNGTQLTVGSIESRTVTKHSVLYRQPTDRELVAANRIVACAKGYLVRRLMCTERVQSTVQTIRDALLCALQLHQDREGIRGADVDLHRRLIQQITAACYTLHDTFVTSSATERCSIIAADRARRHALATRQSTPVSRRRESREIHELSELQNESYDSLKTSNRSVVSDSDQETFNGDKRSRFVQGSRRLPWR